MTQVMRASGQWRLRALATGRTWTASPMAESMTMQISLGGGPLHPAASGPPTVPVVVPPAFAVVASTLPGPVSALTVSTLTTRTRADGGRPGPRGRRGALPWACPP